MENTNVNCSVFFNTADFDFDDEMCLKLENGIMLEDEYDQYLYEECALVEEKIKGNVMFEDEYDESLYRECALVEEKINRQVGGSLKIMNDSQNADIAVKRARYEDGPSAPPTGSRNTKESTSNNGNEGDDKVDKDGLTRVKKKRRPKSSRNRNQCGTAPLSTGLALKAVVPTVSIYLSRLDPNTTEESIRRYVDKRGRCRIKEPPAVLVHGLRRLESTRYTNFKSYVLRVAAKYKDIFLAPDFWTAGVVYRRYREAPIVKM